jgi:anaerobic selenocysteine-containing dehydrogenase
MADEAFLKEFTVGSEELREHVRCYDPARVSSITGVPEEDLYKLARLYGNTQPSFIRIGNGLQHHDNGGMNVRTIACLPAITGAWLHKGGGAIKSNSGYLTLNERALQRHDLLKKSTRRINMNHIGEALLELTPPIRSLFIYNSNPAIVAPDANKVREGLAREDLLCGHCTAGNVLPGKHGSLRILLASLYPLAGACAGAAGGEQVQRGGVPPSGREYGI